MTTTFLIKLNDYNNLNKSYNGFDPTFDCTITNSDYDSDITDSEYLLEVTTSDKIAIDFYRSYNFIELI